MEYVNDHIVHPMHRAKDMPYITKKNELYF